MSREEVARVLVSYGRELERLGAAQVGESFSGDPEADELLAEPNAFLIGVLFTQGIPAERAWSGPLALKRRLGTLDLGFLATHEADVRAAVQQERLLAFDGIGRKKAVMTTEILMRHFGVNLLGKECGQVAYDIQVRRVFLRSGLAEEDSPGAIEAAAAQACPEAPGTIDLPAWLIGRETCRPRSPRCNECVLAGPCARRTWIQPVGVGVRTGPRVGPP